MIERAEIARALPVSALAFTVDVALLHALVAGLGVHYLLAASAGFCAGTAIAYIFSVSYVFRFRRLHSRAAEFVTFAVVGSAGLGLNAVAMYLGVEHADLHYLAAKFAAAGCTFFFNLLVRKLLLFSPGVRFGGSRL